jgi:hypothetical protein
LELEESSDASSNRGLNMAAPSHIYTIERAAERLGVTIDLLKELAVTMEPEDGCLWLHDHTEDGRLAFTDFGIKNTAEQLSDPTFVAHLKNLMHNPA